MNATNTLRDLASLIPSSFAAHVAVCEYSSEDNTPTLHVDLWREYGLHDLPEAVASLVVASEGHWDGGDSYSLQLAPAASAAAEALPNVSGLLARVTDATGPQYLAEGFDLQPYSLDPTRGEFRLWVNFWNSADRDTGLMLLLSALSLDWYEVQTQSSNLLRLSEIELILVPVERAENLLTEDARSFDRDGMQICGGGIEIELRQDADGMQWVRIGSTVHDAEECLVNVTNRIVDHLPSGHQFRW